jgi:hypothetical protein
MRGVSDDDDTMFSYISTRKKILPSPANNTLLPPFRTKRSAARAGRGRRGKRLGRIDNRIVPRHPVQVTGKKLMPERVLMSQD